MVVNSSLTRRKEAITLTISSMLYKIDYKPLRPHIRHPIRSIPMFDRRDPINSCSEPLNDHSGLPRCILQVTSSAWCLCVCPSLPSRVSVRTKKQSVLLCSSVDARWASQGISDDDIYAWHQPEMQPLDNKRKETHTRTQCRGCQSAKTYMH